MTEKCQVNRMLEYKDRVPDIYIAGVMKGGTTILHEYLCTHPDIVSGSKKEIHYFSLHYDKGLNWYATHFSHVPTNKRTVDASPTYFDAANTALIPRLIKAVSPNPQILVITRDPIERAVSHFVHLRERNRVRSLQEMSADEFFRLPLSDAYAERGELGFFLNQVLGFSYYTRKLLRYKSVFSEVPLYFIDNAELRFKPRETLTKVFAFLGCDYVENSLFGKIKHSNGSSVQEIDKKTYSMLAGMLYPDYQRYCKQAGLEFNAIDFNTATQDIA